MDYLIGISLFGIVASAAVVLAIFLLWLSGRPTFSQVFGFRPTKRTDLETSERELVDGGLRTLASRFDNACKEQSSLLASFREHPIINPADMKFREAAAEAAEIKTRAAERKFLEAVDLARKQGFSAVGDYRYYLR